MLAKFGGLVVTLLLAAPGWGVELPLIDAVQEGDQRRVLELLRSGASVNASRSDGSTPLAWAVSRENVEIVAALNEKWGCGAPAFIFNPNQFGLIKRRKW